MKKILLVLLLCATARADTWLLKDVRWVGPTDSVRLNDYSDGVLTGTALRVQVNSWDTTRSVSVGHRYDMVYSIYFTGQSVPTSWVFTRDMIRAGGTTYQWHLTDVTWGTTADSAQLRYYSDSTTLRGTSVTKRSTGVSTYDTTLTAYVGRWNQANILIWFPNEDSAATWSWVWDLTDTARGSITTPSNPNRCLVYGKIIRQDGTKREIEGGHVEIIRSMLPNAAANASGINVMIAGLPTYAPVDSSGYWQAYVVGTHEFTADTTRGFYNFRFLTRNGKELFNLQRVWVPSSGALNLSDTLNARVQ